MTDQPAPATNEAIDKAIDDAPNEILATVKEAKQHGLAAARELEKKARTWPLATIGLAAGIGSAAIAGAVLFATREKRGK